MWNFKRLSLNAKLMMVACGLAAACVIVASIGVIGLSATENDFDVVIDEVIPRLTLWNKVKAAQFSISMSERSYLNESNIDTRKTIAGRIAAEKKVLDSSLKKLSSLGHSLESKKAEAASEVAQFTKATAAWWDILQAVQLQADQGRRDEAHLSLARANLSFEALSIQSSKFIDSAEFDLSIEHENVDDTIHTSRFFVVIIMAFMVSVGLFLAYRLMVSLRDSIDSVVKSLADNSTSVAAASEQVAASAGKLSKSTAQQSSSLQETASSAEELTSMVQRNRENAQTATRLTASSQASAQKGQKVVQDMATAINDISVSNIDISNAVSQSNRKISEITRVIAEIGNKTKIINDIVFQTKLLSFNASVEAARAGEHGKGFAVVAEEVGNLARMSGAAAKDIRDMLDASIEKVETIVKETGVEVDQLVKTGQEKVEAGTQIVNACSAVLGEIVNMVSEVSRMSTEIAAASNEQAQGVQEISRAVAQLDGVTHSNSGAAEQAASAAASLSDQARSLRVTVGDLQAIVSGADEHGTDRYVTGKKGWMSAMAAWKKKNQAPVKKQPVKQAEKSEKQAVPSESKSVVVPFPKKDAPSEESSSSGEALKLAAGGDVEIPAENDPRFQDV